nr:MAG: polyprotein [Sanya leptocorisa acuta iflavirus 1]
MDCEATSAISQLNELLNSLLCVQIDEKSTRKDEGPDGKRGRRMWYYNRRVRWRDSNGNIKQLSSVSKCLTLRDAKEYSARRLLDQFEVLSSQSALDEASNNGMSDSFRMAQNRPFIQMDSVVMETEQGEPAQESDKQENTIITRDQGQAIADSPTAGNLGAIYSSSERFKQHPNLTDRWMPYETYELSTTAKVGDEIATLTIPADLLKKAQCAPNLLPFEVYVLAQTSAQIKLLTNASPFNVGKILVSVIYDCYEGMEQYVSINTCLQRPHVILDISARNEGVLDIPFLYHRDYLLINPNDGKYQNAEPAHYAMVKIHVLSPLRVSSTSATTVSVRVFYRLKDIKFTGLSFRKPFTQGDVVEAILDQVPTKGIKKILNAAEAVIDQIGKQDNMDKPKTAYGSVIIPRPRLNFSSGIGISDAVALRSNPCSLTTFYADHQITNTPKTVLDIARIWGILATFQWKSTNKVGDVLYSLICDPTMRKYTADYSGVLTPIEYVSSFYAFWGGPTEIRLDFVSSGNYHNGTVLLSAQYIRAAEDVCAYESCYTKTFHLGKQKSVSMTIPWISETPYRRNGSGIMRQEFNAPTTTDDLRKKTFSVCPTAHIRLSVVVMNPLRFIADASNEISVLVFWRAGPTFTLNTLCNSHYNPVTSHGRDQFPDNYNLPTVQMDTGEKENQDSTDDFQPGKILHNLCRIDPEQRIKDILRKPILLYRRVKIASSVKNAAMVLPCNPPCPADFVSESDVGIYKYFQLSALTSPQLMLLRLFRFFRGSMQYTIVSHSQSVLYITHVPRSGSSKTGMISAQNGSETNEGGFESMGFNTEILSPIVNQTATVEVPYTSELKWTLMNEANASKNYSWHDKVDGFNGHLAISAYGDSTVDIWWAAGDDFEVSNWYGIPPVKSNQWAYILWETGNKQKISDSLNKISSTTKKTPTQNKPNKLDATPEVQMDDLKLLGSAALASIPYVGIPLTIANTQRNVHRRLDRVQGNIDQVTQDFHNFVDMLGGSIQSVAEAISNVFTTVTSYSQIFLNLCADLFIYLRTRNYEVLGVALVRVLCALDVTKTIAMFKTHIRDLVIWFSDKFSGRPSVQADTNVTFIGIMIGIACTLLGVDMSMKRREKLRKELDFTFSEELLYRLTHSTGISYMNAIIRLVKDSFVAIKEVVMRLLGYVSVEAHTLAMFKETKLILSDFVKDAHIIMNEINTRNSLRPNFRWKFWKCVTEAYNIQKMLVQLPKNEVSPVLSRLCCDVIKLGNEKLVDINASPVRWEPMVIAIEGAAGVGKSYIINRVISKLFGQGMPFDVKNELVFVRTPGNRFWTGYANQPVILYDDWMNLATPELVSQQLAELYNLKSEAVFIPEMAHLEEKRMRLNPLIVVLLCNDAFPDAPISTIALHKEAVYRRRDLIVKVHSSETSEAIRAMPKEDPRRINSDWLSFSVYESPLDPNSCGDENMDSEGLVSYLQGFWTSYVDKEKHNVEKRMKELQQVWKFSDVELDLLRDPFAAFYNYESYDIPAPLDYLPSSVIEHDMRQIEERIARYVNEHHDRELLEPPETDEVPVVQMYGLATQLFSAVIETPWFVHSAIKWGVSRVQRLLQYLQVVRKDEIQPCTRCGVKSAAYYKCSEGHGMCRICVRSSLISSIEPEPAVRCQCGVVSRPYISERTRAEAGLNYAALKLGIISTEQFLDRMYTVIRISAHYESSFAVAKGLLAAIALVIVGVDIVPSLIVNTVGCGIAKAAYSPNYNPCKDFSEESYVYVNTNYLTIYKNEAPCCAENKHRNLHIPEEDEEEDEYYECDEDLGVLDAPSDVITSTLNFFSGFFPSFQIDDDIGVIPELSPDYSSDYAEKHYCLVPATDINVPCLHSKLMTAIPSISFRGGHWIIVTNGTELKLADKCLNPMCILRQKTLRDEFFSNYLSTRSSMLYKKIVKIWNNPLDNCEVDNVPPVLIPSLLRGVLANKAAYVEIEHLTAETSFFAFKDYSCWQIVAGICGLAALGVGLWYSFDALTNLIRSTPESVSQISDETHKKSSTATMQSPNVTPSRVRYVPEPKEQIDGVSGGTSSQFQASRSYVVRNYFAIHCKMSSGKMRVLTGCGIMGHQGILPKHYRRFMEMLVLQDSKVKFVISSHLQEQLSIPYTYNREDFQDIHGQDLSVFRLPKNFPIFKDISKFIADDAIVDTNPTGSALLMVPPNTSNPFLTQVAVEIFKWYGSMEVSDYDGGIITNEVTIEYNFSQKGACGAILLKPEYNKPILGMHFAGFGEGSHGKGYAVPLTWDSLSQFFVNPVVEMDDLDVLEPLSSMKLLFDDDVSVKYHGAVPPSLAVFNNKKSMIQRSAIQKFSPIPPRTEPAILSATDPRWKWPDTSPLRAGCSKHGIITQNLPDMVVSRAFQAFRDLIMARVQPMLTIMTVMTPEEAVIGKKLLYYDPMNLQTSAGWPWCTNMSRSTKEHWITVERDDDLFPISACIDSTIISVLTQKEELRKQKIVPFTLFVDQLKDERRKIEKARSFGGTRVFCGSPVDFVVSLRQYYLHFFASYMYSRWDCMHAVGINIHGNEWTHLVRNLLSVSPHIVTIDYSNFGPAFNSIIGHRVMDAFNSWVLSHYKYEETYRQELENILECFAIELLQSNHLAVNTVYQQFSGAPSGSAATTVLNTGVNQMLLLCAWVDLMEEYCKEKNFVLFELFQKYVCLYCYGDDVIMAVHPEIIHLFNAKTISNYFKNFGIVSTDAGKGQEVEAYTDIYHAKFLGCYFVKHPYFNEWLSALDKEKLEDIPLWVHGKLAIRENTLESCRVALEWAHGWGPNYFQNLKDKINIMLTKAKLPNMVMQWEDIDKIFFSDYY